MDKKTRIEEEKRLIASYLGGSEKAGNAFVNQYSKLVYSAIYKTLAGKGWILRIKTPDDFHNEIFASLLENDFREIRQFRWENNATFATYLSTKTRNHILDFIRTEGAKARRRDSLDEIVNTETGATRLEELEDDLKLVDKTPSALERLSEQERKQFVREAIQKLNEDDQKLVDLLFYRDFSHADAARFMGKSVDALYMQKKRIYEKLKSLLKNRVGF